LIVFLLTYALLVDACVHLDQRSHTPSRSVDVGRRAWANVDRSLRALWDSRSIIKTWS